MNWWLASDELTNLEDNQWHYFCHDNDLNKASTNMTVGHITADSRGWRNEKLTLLFNLITYLWIEVNDYRHLTSPSAHAGISVVPVVFISQLSQL